MWIDRLLVLGGLIGLIAFLGVLIYFVAEPDLILVVCICVIVALYDFGISVFKNDGTN